MLSIKDRNGKLPETLTGTLRSMTQKPIEVDIVDKTRDDTFQVNDVETNKLETTNKQQSKIYKANTEQQDTPQRTYNIPTVCSNVDTIQDEIKIKTDHANIETTGTKKIKIIDNNDINIIISYKELLKFMSDNFVCR